MSRSNTLYPTAADAALHNGKFTNGVPEEGVPASLVKAETLNLLLDNLEEAARAAGIVPDNADPRQLKDLVEQLSGRVWHVGVAYRQGSWVLYNSTQYICTQNHTATALNAPGVGSEWVELELWQRDRLYPVGHILTNYNDNTNPAARTPNPLPGTWEALPPNYYLAQAGDRYEPDRQYSDGLPNIEGKFGYEAYALFGSAYGGTGAFSRENSTGAANDRADSGRSYGGAAGYDFNANRSSSIYGRTDYVRPKTIGVYMFRKAAYAYSH